MRDSTRDCSERAIRSSVAGPFEHKLPAPLTPYSSSHLNTDKGWEFNENSVLLKPSAAATRGSDRDVLFTYFALCELAVG